MIYEWDENKRQANLEKHGVDFEQVHLFDWQTAKIVEDLRYDYGEPRAIAFGMIDARLYVLVYTWREGAVRVIGLRKANEREGRFYG